MLKNPVVRVMLSTAAAVYLAPAIQRAFVRPTLTPGEELVQDVGLAGIFGAVTSAVFTILTMTLGAPASTVGAGTGGAA